MALGARIGRRSRRARMCNCPRGAKKVFVGDYGIRCGAVRRIGGRRRFVFIRTPKRCNI